MRVFVAVDLPPKIRKTLKELQQQLRQLTASARWVSTESIHITLKFIGEVHETRIAEIHNVLSSLRQEAFDVAVRGVGFFSEKRSPRVFWVGLETAVLSKLAEDIESRMERIGFEKDKRPFQPHVTLARARDNRIDPSLVATASKLSQHVFGAFTVHRFFLIQSTLKPTGAVYNKLKEYTLG